ncbi:7-cyano-7-deazaguanine synthase QueC [Legionella sp. W05-934-2]|uniref:7-cyano-7-deazaguanine synthase QueC n=1 Tax=Legionella sp. W05-934-2 TaxID=1198649 RepID=UPI0034618096
MSNINAVVLLSGGLDSATCVAIAKQQGFDVHALSFSYGQRHAVELQAAKRVAHHLGVKQHHIVDMDLAKFGGSALTDNTINVPDYQETNHIPVTYVPARNLIFLSMATALAETLNARDIFIGISSVDYSGYPDCRPDFIKSFQQTATLGTKMGTEGQSVTIHSPLQHLSKAETVKLGINLGVDYGLTVSCYQANKQGAACGRCDSCHYRKQGFKQAGIKDPTIYTQIASID